MNQNKGQILSKKTKKLRSSQENSDLFEKKETYLILGGFGFIGSNLIEELEKKSHLNLIVFENPSATNPNPSTFSNLKIYTGDFNNPNDVEKIFIENKVDLIIHLISSTIPATQNYVYDIESNLISTIRLLDLMIKYQIKKIVFLSSGGAVYGISDQSQKEDSPTNPISSYGVIKITIEKYLHLYNHLYGLNYLILRPSNPYGPYHRSKEQGLINVIIRNILANEKVIIFGDGSIIRDYIYVKDLAKIIVELIQKKVTNEIINVGSGSVYSVNDVLDLVRNQLGDFEIENVSCRKFDVNYIGLDISKLKTIIDFQFTSLEEGLKLTLSWSKNNY